MPQADTFVSWKNFNGQFFSRESFMTQQLASNLCALFIHILLSHGKKDTGAAYLNEISGHIRDSLQPFYRSFLHFIRKS